MVGYIPRPCLCLVTSLAVCGSADALVERVAAAVNGGVNMVQLREKDLAGGELLDLARRLKGSIAGKALLFVNERVDVALACGAEGVQLGESALPAREARRIAGERLLIGRSVHGLDSALEAAEDGADVLIVGTIFETASHPGAHGVGVGLIRSIASQTDLPLIGIGGVEEDNVAQVMEAGAAGVAVIRSVLASPDPEASACGLWEAIGHAR